MWITLVSGNHFCSLNEMSSSLILWCDSEIDFGRSIIASLSRWHTLVTCKDQSLNLQNMACGYFFPYMSLCSFQLATRFLEIQAWFSESPVGWSHLLFCSCYLGISINSTHFTLKNLGSNLLGQLIYKDFDNMILILWIFPLFSISASLRPSFPFPHIPWRHI